MQIKYKILKLLYRIKPGGRKLAIKFINHTDGGEFYSQCLRKFYKEKYRIEVGIASYGCFVPDFNFGSPIVIGNYCSFASGVQFIPGNHPISDVSTHPFFHRSEFGFIKNNTENNKTTNMTIVGHDVWIGRNAIILPNCKKIGNGAIIGAGAVVTRDIEPYSIVAGNPARLIKYRFSDEEIKLLEESRWYLKTPSELADSFQFHDDITAFVNSVRLSPTPNPRKIPVHKAARPDKLSR